GGRGCRAGGRVRAGGRRRPGRPGRRVAQDRRGRGRARPGPAAASRVINDRRFSREPWAVRETSLDLDALGQAESIFALSNGRIGWRANLDEGEPYAISGSYLNGVYEEVPLPYAESAYGYREAGETTVNVTDG